MRRGSTPRWQTVLATEPPIDLFHTHGAIGTQDRLPALGPWHPIARPCTRPASGRPKAAATPGTLDEAMLDRALTCYRRAAELAPNQLYPLMNAARIELLLAGRRRTNTEPARARIEQLEHLARFAVHSSADKDPWAAFDLADTLLLTGRAEEGLAVLRRAADLCVPEERTAILKTAAEPMNDLLTVVDAFEPPVAAALRDAIELCKTLAFQD